jgi:hypothetical protein
MVERLSVNKMRIVFVGAIGSEIPLFVETLCERVQGISDTLVIQKLSLLDPLNNLQGRYSFDPILTGAIVNCLIPDYYWERQLIEKVNVNADVIVVDDVRFQSQAQYLRECGFILVCVNTPWNVRFKNIRTDQVSWFSNEDDIDLEKIPKEYFDYTVCCMSEMNELIDKLL